jgi:hypothetical protein
MELSAIDFAVAALYRQAARRFSYHENRPVHR